MSNAHGDANSDASIQNASHVNGANSVTVVSGGDTNIIGSQINSRQIAADVGGNLNIVSVQDVTNSAAHCSWETLMNKEFRIRLLLALQASLLGHISANIRAVSCSVAGENITVQVVFDGPIVDQDKSAMDEVGSELASHFEHEMVDMQCIRIDAPQPFRDSPLELRAYQRRE